MTHTTSLMLRFTFSLALVLSMMSCSASKSQKPNPNDIITIGMGGGISGGYSGFRIKRTGEVTAWRQKSPTAKDSDYMTSMTSPDSVEFFFRYLDEIQFDKLKFEHQGNMSFYVERSLPTPHRLTWEDNPEGGPPEASVFYRLVLAYTSRQLHPSKP